MADEAKKTLVLGGARSGKSHYAERMAEAHDGPRIYIATAQANDDEMAERIREHQERRGEHWTTVGVLLDLAGPLNETAGDDAFVLIDCLTLWLSNMMLAERNCEVAVSEFVTALSEAPGTIVVVSNEVGLGIVPDNPLGRRFRDLAGYANQRVAEVSDEVVFMAAGLPMRLKPSTT